MTIPVEIKFFGIIGSYFLILFLLNRPIWKKLWEKLHDLFAIPVAGLFSCRACGQDPDKDYIRAMGHVWHREHFVCAQCRKPINGNYFFERGNKPYCHDCHKKKFINSCTVCGKKPKDNSSEIDTWGNAYCSTHHSKLPRCNSCDRIISRRSTGGGVQYEDGRHCCMICYSRAVRHPKQAHKIMKRVARFLKKKGLFTNPKEVELLLVPSNKILTGALGTFELKTYDKKSSSKKCIIKLLHGMSAEMFSGSLAHELGHLWLHKNGLSSADKKTKEGFCELVLWLWLKHLNTHEARHYMNRRLNNGCDIYGGGLRQSLRKAEKEPLKKLIYKLQSN